MKTTHKKIVLALVTACFVLTATNILLALHLAEHDGDEEHHDHDKCLICLHAAIFKAITFDAADDVCVIRGHAHEQLAPESIKLSQLTLDCKSSRAPPFVC
jgi:hypothetical protein